MTAIKSKSINTILTHVHQLKLTMMLNVESFAF